MLDSQKCIFYLKVTEVNMCIYKSDFVMETGTVDGNHGEEASK